MGRRDCGGAGRRGAGGDAQRQHCDGDYHGSTADKAIAGLVGKGSDTVLEGLRVVGEAAVGVQRKNALAARHVGDQLRDERVQVVGVGVVGQHARRGLHEHGCGGHGVHVRGGHRGGVDVDGEVGAGARLADVVAVGNDAAVAARHEAVLGQARELARHRGAADDKVHIVTRREVWRECGDGEGGSGRDGHCAAVDERRAVVARAGGDSAAAQNIERQSAVDDEVSVHVEAAWRVAC
mmetsp:Transcript_10538/g.42993  ORF Transcript_10538/g.42993 Transcript_10538/m.42993 type:complete len:237 (-) Transcript_10538:1465-2175(-)